MVSSPVWDNVEAPVTFGFGEGGYHPEWYQYSALWGLPAGVHPAADVGIPCGTNLYAVREGMLSFADTDLQYYRPHHVDITWHENGEQFTFIYGHLDELGPGIVTGATVKAGQYLGKSGEQTYEGTFTPDGSGCHVHLEFRNDTQHIVMDPIPFVMNGNITPYGGDDTSNWPTADAINAFIDERSRLNGHISPLTGLGEKFLEFGERYGINPGVVTAIIQKESQMGTDGSVLPDHNNFAGIMGKDIFVRDRTWATYATPEGGLQAVFTLLDSDIYRKTGGKLVDIIEVYSPASDGNNVEQMFANMAATGTALGITINKDTNIYSRGGNTGSGSGGNVDVTALAAALGKAGTRIGLGLVGVLVVGIGLIMATGGGFTPVGRMTKAVRAAL